MSEATKSEERCWNAELEEVSSDVGETLPSVVGYRQCSGGTWCVHTRFNGEDVLAAEGLDFGEAVDMVMTVFGNLLEETKAVGRRPLPA